MAFSEQEKQIINYGFKNGKSKTEVMEAIDRFRKTGSPIDPDNPPVVEEPQPTRIQETVQDIRETGEDIGAAIGRGAETAREVQGQVERGERTPGFGTFRTIGAGLQAGAEALGETAKGIGKAILPQRAEEAVGEAVTGAAQSVVESKPAQFAIAEYQNLSPQQKEAFEAGFGVVEGVATMFGAGPVVSKVRQQFGRRASKLLKESDDILTEIRKSTEAPKGVDLPELNRGIKGVRLSLSDIDPADETVFRRSSIQDVERHFEQARKAVANDLESSPFEIVAETGLKGLEKVSQARQKAVQAKKEILDQVADTRIPGNAINDVYSSGVQRFADDFGVRIDSKGNVTQAPGRISKLDPSDQRLVSNYFERMNKLGVAPTLRQVDDFIDYAQSQLYKQGQSMTKVDVASEPVIQALRNTTGDLNGRLKQEIDGYAEVNQRIRDLMLIEDELNRGLGKVRLPDGSEVTTRGAGFVKRLFSPSGENTRRAFQQLFNETGIDLAKEARLAKFAMDNVGDARQKSLLRQLDVAVQESAEIDLTKPASIVRWLRERADLDGEELAKELIKKFDSEKIDLSSPQRRVPASETSKGAIANPFGTKKVTISGKTFKSVDANTKDEMIDVIDYLRNGTEKPNIEDTLSRLAEKYNINQELPSSRIAELFQKLVENTKTTGNR